METNYIKQDKIHYDGCNIMSYNKPFNFVISCREVGKSTWVWLYAYFQCIIKNRTFVVIRRQITDITDIYISDIEKILNKFGNNVKFRYKTGELKDGVVDVYIETPKGNKLFFRVIALSNPMSRIKSLMMPNVKAIIFDEFICNTRMKEKYLADESFKYKELFNTFQRESNDIIAIFLGNPYSLYNPYFQWMDIPIKDIAAGKILSGKQWALECYKMKDELRKQILKRNPLYQFDEDTYKVYALDGIAINDENIKIVEKCPQNYRLKYIFRFSGYYIGCFYNNNLEDENNKFWCGIIDYVGESRKIYCFDFGQLVDGSCILSPQEKVNFVKLKIAMMRRKTSFSDVGTAYMMEEIYDKI